MPLRELTARYFYPRHVSFILPSFPYLRKRGIVSSDSHERTGKRLVEIPKVMKVLWQTMRERQKSKSERGKESGKQKRKREEERQVSCWEHSGCVAILRTFTANQFFRLIIQHARMHLDPFGDCIWRPAAIWKFENGKKGNYTRREPGIQKPGDYGLKNVTPFPKATIFIVIEAAPTADAAWIPRDP